MRRHAAFWLVLLIPTQALAQRSGPAISLDFEHGLTGWHQQGTAFAAQPMRAADFRTDTAAQVTIGGDYWRDLIYPVGHQGTHFVRTPDGGRGSLVSDEFTLGAADRVFSVLVGGSHDVNARVELQVLTERADDPPAIDHDGGFTVLFRATGNGQETLRRALFTIPTALAGRRVRIRLVDDSDGAHLNVDDVRLTAEAPEPSVAPVWGLGDFHTHPMTHMAFGALRGARALWGVPGRGAGEYESAPWLAARDIPHCEPDHRGGRSAEIFVNTAEGRFVSRGLFKDLWSVLTGRLTRHHREGGPEFSAFPGFTTGAHQQMHITQMHRAWRGGLRLMVAIAVHNIGVEFLTANLENGVVKLSSERDVLEAQVCGMRQLAALNSAWMEIAYDPSQARDIITQGRLAIVLGIEMDQMGALGVGTADAEVAYLWNLGIRQVTPIHAIDNALGGAAVFQSVYNSLNDLLHRKGGINLRPGDLKGSPAEFFKVEEVGCSTPNAPPAGECTEFALEAEQQRAVLTRSLLSGFRLTPFVVDREAAGYEGKRGMANTRGLAVEGRRYLGALMDRGMIVGLEHMSRRSVLDVYEVVAERLVDGGHPECGRFGQDDAPASCDAAAYPLNVSHAHFRRLSLPHDRTTVAGFRASEYEVGERQASVVVRTGGVIGQFVSEDPVVLPSQPPFKNDCAGSSKSFAASLFYALTALDWTGVGVATDFTFIPGASPRFGEYACWARAAAKDPDEEQGRSPGQYNLEQEGGVRYVTGAVADGVRLGANQPLEPSRLGDRVYDFNVDGFAHYGLLPDLLQDVKNVGVPARVFESLFSSAESYLRMWDKAGRLAPLATRQFTPAPLNCVVSCKGLCPQDPFAGAPH